MKLIIVTLCCVGFQVLVMGQNLVPNPSFEIYDTCPNVPGQITYAVGWFQPNILYSFSSYNNECAEGTSVGVPHNQIGYQYAHTGKGYASVSSYWKCDTCSSIEREYIEVILIDSLKKNKKYNVSFYVSLGDSSIWATNNIQCYFSKNIVQESTMDLKCLCSCIPQISYDSIITDTATWVNITGSFIAQGGEQYLTVGNFYPDSLTKKDSLTIKSQLNGTGYYIDDISVTEDTTTGINELYVNSGVKITPNPSNGVFTMQSSVVSGQLSVEVYNTLGLMVYSNQFQNYDSPFIIDLSNQPVGLFFYRIMNSNGKLASMGKIIIEK